MDYDTGIRLDLINNKLDKLEELITILGDIIIENDKTKPKKVNKKKIKEVEVDAENELDEYLKE